MCELCINAWTCVTLRYINYVNPYRLGHTLCSSCCGNPKYPPSAASSHYLLALQWKAAATSASVPPWTLPQLYTTTQTATKNVH